MESFRDIHNRSIRLTEERQRHLQTAHPEMADGVFRIAETLAEPDKIAQSVTGETVELFYKHYPIYTCYEQVSVHRRQGRDG